MHTFSSERRSILLIPQTTLFYEETFWNPSWATAEGAVQTTDITDLSKSMEAVGTGALLSRASWAAQGVPHLIGFGKGPLEGCPACGQNTAARNYGLGVVELGPWITQTKLFAGNGFTVGYLPWRRFTITVVATADQDAFDREGNYNDASAPIFQIIANALAPGSLPSR